MGQTYASTFGGHGESLDIDRNEIIKRGYEIIPTDIWHYIFVEKNGKTLSKINIRERYYTLHHKMYVWNGIEDYINHINNK